MYIFLSPAQILTGREHDTVTKQITHFTHHCLEDKERKTKAKGKVTIVWCGTRVCNLNTSEVATGGSFATWQIQGQLGIQETPCLNEKNMLPLIAFDEPCAHPQHRQFLRQDLSVSPATVSHHVGSSSWRPLACPCFACLPPHTTPCGGLMGPECCLFPGSPRDSL